MRKVVIHRPGGYDRLRIEDHPDPRPGPGEVLLHVEAAGVNYADCIVRMGLYASARTYVGWPITPGFEVAGRVAAAGEGVTWPAAGDAVLALTRFGGYTSHLIVQTHQVFKPPAGLDASQSAAFPAVFLTAWYALFELAHPRPGSRLLVHSAAGGVGGALVQLGRLAGCDVVGVVGAPHKVEAARAHGATAVIDKSTQDLWATARRHAPAGYDVIFDANGPPTLARSYRHLASPGKLVVYGFHGMLPRRGGRPNWPKLALGWLRTPRFDPLAMTNQNRSVLAFNLSYLFERRDVLATAMTRLTDWMSAGRIAPPPVTTYPLDRVADAHRDLESGRTVGKLVLLPVG
jgi:NADPH:quinone reductase-like Zn-dependent oxidoreductase